jgi:hypothetical protein
MNSLDVAWTRTVMSVMVASLGIVLIDVAKLVYESVAETSVLPPDGCRRTVAVWPSLHVRPPSLLLQSTSPPFCDSCVAVAVTDWASTRTCATSAARKIEKQNNISLFPSGREGP